ncbi:hypothetical protein B0H10DRAFT_2026216 [Mycena sp. CBHHK59/15]|nr:hypothetical protein B0H10DRAFT_2026216 [Mycena sp. CBHHK59/15]
MAIPELSELEGATRAVVYDSRKEGTLNTLTPRMVRQTLEVKYGLPDGTLDSKEYKNALKLIIGSAATEDMGQEHAGVEVTTRASKKRKSDETEDVPKPKAKRSAKPPAREKSKKSSKEFKSSEMVQSSDIEDNGTQEGRDAETQISKLAHNEDPAKENQTTPLKKRLKVAQAGSSTRETHNDKPPSVVAQDAYNSDSELSVLIDEPPKLKKANKSKDKSDDKPKTTRGKRHELTKDEETIKRLKSLVLACGVRKVWAKVFKDVDKPSQQIRMLKEILTELGMTGRMSLEQAKAIREKRELAQELEDVQSFAAAATRSKPLKALKPSEGDEDDSEEEVLPEKRKTNARRSIMAFLGDQSDED